MAPKTRKETLSSRIVADLRASIVRGDLAPGEKINLDRLREAQDVSISPLREAMSRLVADGLVMFEDQRGYSVTPVSATNLAEITRLRVALETMALRASIAAGDLDWESQVMGALYRLRTTPRGAGSPAAWEAAHTEFHLALLRGANMPLLLHFCAQLRSLQDRYRAIYLGDLPAGRDVQAEHDAIAAAACGRNADLAASRLVAHIEATGALLQMRLLA
ncbi:MAG: GntR family transcriptional regulator [Rhodobacteraceae bacterium]|nr:GntR family transcriptional regulator [Paracoccaceae bacterium]